jgi:hypothetical protein
MSVLVDGTPCQADDDRLVTVWASGKLEAIAGGLR